MYPIAYLHDFSYKSQGCKIFTIIDLIRAYRQIPVAPEDVSETAVVTPFGLFEFRVITFCLKDVAQTVRRYIEIALRGLELCFAYIDNILIASKTTEEHHQHLRIVFERIQHVRLHINDAKCVFGMNYLRHQIDQHGKRQEKVTAIRDYVKPASLEQLRFLGMINFYKRYFPRAAQVEEPLHLLLSGAKKRDKIPISWTP